MALKSEGVIRFRLVHHEADAPGGVGELIEVRRKCRALGMIGQDADGTGFGNLSRRIPDSDRFIISGSGTGGLEEHSADLFTEVLSFEIGSNTLECRGPRPASSESLTHGACYLLSPDICSVLHVHHDRLWHELRNVLPTSLETVPYGTPKMAGEIERLWREEPFPQTKVMVMGGHVGGLIAVGSDPWEPLARLEGLVG